MRKPKLAKTTEHAEIYVAFNGFWVYLFEDAENTFIEWEYFTTDPYEAMYYYYAQMGINKHKA